MQGAYFMGGTSPEGFTTSFWENHRGYYGFLLKGGPGTGKSTLLKKIAGAFPEEEISIYRCASDPRSLDAVVLEKRRIFVADATAPHESGTPLPGITGELIDLGAGLNYGILREQAESIRTLQRQNQACHAQARRLLAARGMAESLIAETTAPALLGDKLAGFAHRLAGRIFPKRGENGRITCRQSCAETPEGFRALFPEGYAVLSLRDAGITAGERLLALLAEEAQARGLSADVTRLLHRRERPACCLILPECKTAVAAFPVNDAPAIQMRRFYDAAEMKKHRTLVRFCHKTAENLHSQATAALAEGLRLHDALEACYRPALDPVFLDAAAGQLICAIREM